MLCSNSVQEAMDLVLIAHAASLEKHEYESVRQMKGSIGQLRCPDPSAFERAQYMRAVKSVQHVQVTSR